MREVRSVNIDARERMSKLESERQKLGAVVLVSLFSLAAIPATAQTPPGPRTASPTSAVSGRR